MDIHIVRRAMIYVFTILLFILSYQSGFAMESGEDGSTPGPSIDSPAVSPDGQRLIFVSNVSGDHVIWMSDRNGNNAHPFINWTDSNQVDPDWSPNGQQIVFSSDYESTNYDIWTINSDGSNPHRITTNAGSNRQPKYSPDGTKILFTSNRTGKRELWYMDVDGNNQKAVGLQSLLINDPSWSPDGSQIIFVGCTLPPNGSAITEAPCNLFKIALDASVAEQLTFGVIDDWSPDWGTSGIIFSSSRSGGHSIWKVDSNGNNLQQITNGDGLHLSPKWDKLTGNIIFTKSAPPSVWSSDQSGNEVLLVTANSPPLANAGPDKTTYINNNVTLDGTNSYDLDNGPQPLTFTWTQTSGPVVNLLNANSETPTFIPTEVGMYAFTLTVSDGLATASDDVSIKVIYDFQGFFQPVDNEPAFNKVKGGSSVPVKFSLSGNQGLDIFAAGYPITKMIACDISASGNDTEQTITAGGSGLNYDDSTNQYRYVWKTSPIWSGSCRQLIMRLKDGTDHTAYFLFK